MDAARAARVRAVVAWVGCFALLAATATLFVVYRTVLAQRQAPIALTLLIIVLLGSVTGGRRLGLSLALAGFLVINYAFQLPYGAFGVHDPSDLLVLASYVFTAAVASRIIARERRQAEAARRRASEVQRLADLGAETLAAGRAEEALQAIADVIARTLRLDRCELWHVADGAAARRVTVSPAGTEPATPRLAQAMRERIKLDDANEPTSPDDRARRLRAILAGAPRDAVLPLRAHHRVVGALRLVRAEPLSLDESERTFLEALAHYAALGVERVRLVADAERAEALREADRLKDLVLATVSHDLRTPLTTIKALAHESARAGDHNAAVIEEQADRLTRMVADLLDLSRARAGALPLATELNTAEDVVGATLRQSGALLHGRRVETHLRPDGGPLVGCFDFVATLRILANLVDNAAKYAPPDGPIEIDVVRDGGEIAFAVNDRGAGVAESERERVFALFHRAPGAVPDVGGTGLGLAVARALAESQGGSLAYRPRPGGGSTFELRLPASDDVHAMGIIEERAGAERRT